MGGGGGGGGGGLKTPGLPPYFSAHARFTILFLLYINDINDYLQDQSLYCMLTTFFYIAQLSPRMTTHCCSELDVDALGVWCYGAIESLILQYKKK